MKTPKEIKIVTLLLLFCTLPFFLYSTSNQNQQTMNDKESILIHLSQGTENPTVAALAFLIARTAVEEGHEVTLFLAGDAVQLMREGALNNLSGLGTGKLKEHYDVLAKADCAFYLSGMSSKSRGLAEGEIEDKNMTLASPKVLVKLAMEKDKMFVY